METFHRPPKHSTAVTVANRGFHVLAAVSLSEIEMFQQVIVHEIRSGCLATRQLASSDLPQLHQPHDAVDYRRRRVKLNLRAIPGTLVTSRASCWSL